MKRLNIICISLVILINNVVYPQHSEHLQDIHKYLTYQAWELVKHQHPEVINSEMNLRIGHWQDGTLNGTGPWQKGKVITGAYREDEEDPVYKHSWPFTSATHFWDADHGDDVTFTPPPFTHNYANSYKKILAYWHGNLNNEAWLELGPFFYFSIPYYIKVKYNDLSEAYKNHSNFLVTHWYDISIPGWIEENPPQPIIPYLMENSPGYSQAEAVALVNRVCWEIVGRILHHIADSGVPAHAHNDPHPTSDYFEDVYMPAHFLEYTWIDALNQGGLININNKQYPLRFSLYTTNQIADRFKSDNYCGDLIFPYSAQYTSDNYESVINPMYQSIYVLPCDGPESVANIIAQKSFVYSIRSSAGFLWYVYNKFNIQTQALPVIHGFTKNLPDNTIYRGETLRITCNATGSNLNFNWFHDVCDLNNWCTILINGLAVSRSDRIYSITNVNFQNRWTCTFYDSLCNNNTLANNNSITEDPLHLYPGVKVSNQFGQATKYYNMNNILSFHPVNGIRPPDPPITGCPVVFTLDTNGFQCGNNILHKSPNPNNHDKDILDKIVIGTAPYTDTADNTIQFAVTETSLYYNYFDKFSVLKIAHPEEFSLFVTNNDDIVLIDLKNVASPKNAVKSGMDVTQELRFDSAFDKGIKGQEKEIITAQYANANYFDVKDKLIHELSKVNFLTNIDRSGIRDSIAIILDPTQSDLTPNPYAKRESGYISVTDTAGIKNTDEINFTRRQRRDPCVIPVLANNEVASAQLNFKQGFDLSYLAVANIFYDGFTTSELKLTDAENSISGDIKKSLTNSDNVYAELDSSSFIILKFKNTEDKLPKGWVFDYVMIIEGRSVEPVRNNENDRPVDIASTMSSENAPYKFSLKQNYPNPFNPVTQLEFGISNLGFVSLKVFDILGNEIKTLVSENKPAGNYTVTFDGSDLPSGIYFCKLTAGHYTAVKRMILLK